MTEDDRQIVTVTLELDADALAKVRRQVARDWQQETVTEAEAVNAILKAYAAEAGLADLLPPGQVH